MNNWDFIGQEWAIQMLKQHLSQGKVRHAYLFTGSPGIGKRTLALRFAMALNCKNISPGGDPCGACRTCRQIQAMQFSDLSVVQAETVGGNLKVDQIREMQHTLSLTPYEGSYRVALILRFQEANLNAQNALLKTLEEAPQKVILLLTADVGEQLLPTIVSRCEVIRLRPVQDNQLRASLQQRLQIDAEKSKILVHLSSGRPGAAISYHEHPEMLEDRDNLLVELFTLLGSNLKKRMDFAYANKDKEKIHNSILVWSSFWRDVMLLTSGSSAPLVNLDYEKALKSLAGQLSLNEVRKILENLTDGLHSLEENINSELLVGVLMLDLPRIRLTDGVCQPLRMP